MLAGKEYSSEKKFKSGADISRNPKNKGYAARCHCSSAMHANPKQLKGTPTTRAITAVLRHDDFPKTRSKRSQSRSYVKQIDSSVTWHSPFMMANRKSCDWFMTRFSSPPNKEVTKPRDHIIFDLAIV